MVTCQYCGARCNLVFDHVKPKAQGGKTQWGNMVYACKRCNAKKGARTPKQARMKLRGRPIMKTKKKKKKGKKKSPQQKAKWTQQPYGISKTWKSKGGKYVTLIVADTELETPKRSKQRKKDEDVPF